MAKKQAVKAKKTILRKPNGEYIVPYTDTKGALDICDIGQSLFVDESQGLRRKLNGSLVYINEHTQAFADKLKSIKHLYPNLFCTEERWQQNKNSNPLGQVGKFVLQEESTIIHEYNVVEYGALNKSNGVVNGFTTDNYFKLPINFQPSTYNWEIIFKIKTGSNVTTEQYIMSFQAGATNETRYATRIAINSSSLFCISVTFNGTAWDIVSDTTGGATGTYIVQPNTEYYVKYSFDGAQYTLSYSTDGINYIPDCNVSSNSFMFNNCTECLIGLWNNGNYLAPFLGSIDMSQSYININGAKWWSGTTSIPTEPYVRIPRVVCMQGTLDLTDLDSYGYIETRRLVASKKPTKEDTYWYNWYSDGWCEQGARVLQNGGTNANWAEYTITLRIPYNDVYYNVNAMVGHENHTDAPSVYNITTKSFIIEPYNNQGTAQWCTQGWAKIPKASDCNLTHEPIDPNFPYFIQIAHAELTTATVRNDWTISEPYTIFEPKYSYNQLNNASWLFSNQQWNTKAVYPFAYEALCIELNDTIPTGEKVQLPSGGYYTKHLQTLVYDPSRFTLIGTPKISKKGFAHTLNSTNYVKFNVGNAMQQSDSYSLKFRMQYINDTVLLSTHNQDTINNSNGWLIRLYDNKLYTSFAMVEGICAHESTPSEMEFIEGDYYYVKLSYTNSYGYKLEVSKDDVKYDLAWEYADVNRFSPVSNEFYFGYDYENVNAIGTPIDLKTIHFRYVDEDEHLISGAYYVPMVYDVNDISKLNADYERKFKVDRLNETFMLPTEVDRELNNGEMLYYYIGDVLQNTALIDIGRMTEALARKIDTDRFDRAYYFRKCPKVTLTQDQSVTYEFSMVSKGRPIFINFNGDQNVTTSTGWARIYMYRNGATIATQTIVGMSASENNAFAMTYLDTNVAYGESITYKITITQHSGTADYSEEGNGLNRIVAFEI